MVEKIFVRIDISKEKLDVSLRPSGDFFQVQNTGEGIRELVKRLSSLSIACIVMEASGGYERLVFALLSQEGFPCSLVNAKKVREFAKVIGKLAKTDRIDAKVLAHYGEAIRPKVTNLTDGKRQLLRELVERREQIVKMKVAEKNRLSQAKGKVRESIESVLDCLERNLREIEGEIERVLMGDEEIMGEVKLLESMKGIGRKTAVTIVAKLPELGKVSHKEIASLVGVAPFSDESGKRKGRREIKGGRKEVRKALYMATLVAIRFNWVIR